MVVRQGDVYWVDLGEPAGSAPGYRHPYVVIQNDVFNASKVRIVIVAAITSNLARAAVPGNVRLAKEEGGLPNLSIVNVTQIVTLDKSDLTHKVGTISRARVREILDGVRLVTEPRDL
jgi:mRNA interferase MazF